MEGSYHETVLTGHDGSSSTIRVPVVQELARQGVHDIPKIFLRTSLDTLSAPAISDSPKDFPSVSMARLLQATGEERDRELEKLASGAREWGMVLLSDHGVQLGGVKEVVKGFFGLSFEEKRESVGTYASADNLGYGRNRVKSDDHNLEWIDRLTMVAAPKGLTDGLNVWPQNPHNFRDVIENYAEEARNVGDELLEILAEALSLDKGTFLRYFDPENSEAKIRINCYPPCPNPGSTLGLNPHSDSSAITLLIQMENSGGLQAMHRDRNVWQNVPWPTDALVVVFGDLLEIMSNGRVYSALHKVVTQPVERFSVALFYIPPSTTEIEPVKRDHPDEDVYKKVLVGDYVQHYYNVSPAYGKETTLKFARV